MWKEVGHFIRYAPATIGERRKLGRTAFYDLLEQRIDRAGKAAWRQALVGDLDGDVLEIGAGTGLCFPFYGSRANVTAIEPDPEFLAEAQQRAAEAAAQIVVERGAGEHLSFPDASFDAVVVACVLCSVDSVERTLSEIRRVLRSGGRLRLMEHYRSERLIPGLLMSAFNPIWLALNQQGCNMNRDPDQAVRAAGFGVTSVERFQIFAEDVLIAFPYKLIRALRA